MPLTMTAMQCLKAAQRNIALLAIKKQSARRYFDIHCLPKGIMSCSSLRNDLSQHFSPFKMQQTKSPLKLFCTSATSEILSLADSILDQSCESHSQDKKNELVKVLNFLVSHGYSMSKIKEKYQNYITPTHASYIKAKHIAELDSDIISLMPFMTLSVSSLRKAAKEAREDKNEIKGFPNRITYLAHHLETSRDELVPSLMKHSALLTMKFKRLHHKMNILIDAEISPKDLVKDLWIFNYNEKLLARRISAAEEAGVKLKPWMLRCSESFFTSMLNKYSETQRILNGEDIFSYLSKKLECSKEYVEHLMERNKLLKVINIPKIEQIINFLFEKGYTPQEVRLFPRVFCSSVETLNSRLEDYRQIRSTLPTISQLCIASKKFKSKLDKHDQK